MKRTLLVLFVIVAMSSPAAADKSTWEGVFFGSFSVALIGGGVFWYGTNQIDHAERQLCTDEYANDCGHPPPSTQAEVDRLNDKGASGSTLVKVGAVTMLVGGGVAVYAFYKAFVAKDAGAAPAMTFAPVLSRDSAGASLQLRW